MLVSNIAVASPLLVTHSNRWDEKTKLFLGNCSIPFFRCHSIKPKGAWGSHSRWIDLVVETPYTKSFEHLAGYQTFKKNKAKDPKIFGLWDGGAGQKSVLFLIGDEVETDIARFELPFSVEAGTLTLSDAYYANAWHTVLVVMAKDRLGEKNRIIAFDVTDSIKPLQPFLEESMSTFFPGSERAIIVRLTNGYFGIVVVGSLNHKGNLRIILFDHPKNFLQVSVGEKALSFLTAVDLTQQGFVDKMYVSDETQVWALDFTDPFEVLVEKLGDAKMFAPPIVIRDPKGEGFRIYFLGEVLKQKGFFMVQDFGARTKLIQLVAEGNFSRVFLRFGYFLFVPEDFSLKPWAMEVSSHQQVPLEWHPVFSSVATNDKIQTRVILTKLLWDPKTEQEILLTLNPSCQLNILALDLPNNKYGRVAWRKMQK